MGCYDYEEPLRLAGAQVHAFESFGSYQGEWWALVTYQGQTGWITSSYGSCSGCDAWQGHTWKHAHAHEDAHEDAPKYVDKWNLENLRDGCDACALFREEVAAFGRDYLGEIVSHEAALKAARESWESPMDVVALIEKHAPVSP